MKYHITFEIDPDEKENVPDEKPGVKNNHQDMFRLGEIRETLWGKGPPVAVPRDLLDLSGIRKTLWGR